MSACPCGSGLELEACCGPIMEGAPAPTAETLMRARYTAFVTNRIDDFAYDTLAPEARDGYDRDEVERAAREAEGVSLDIRHVIGGTASDEIGSVEFVARFRIRGQMQVHHELATFRQEEGRWLYVDGEINPKSPPVRVVKIGRNDPCPCGSGKKYKKCCGA